MNLSPDFTLQEFQAVSDRPLTSAQITKARTHAQTILQPVRDHFGPVDLTSFVRHYNDVSSQPHANGDAVDFVARNATTAQVNEFIATRLGGRFGEVIDERDHNHVTLYGVGGRGEVLRETRDGVYQPASYPPPMSRDATRVDLPTADPDDGPAYCVFCVAFWTIVIGGALWYKFGR